MVSDPHSSRLGFSIENTIALAGVIVTLLVGLFTGYISYSINSLGPTLSPKSLQQNISTPVNSLSRPNIPDSVKLYATIDGQTLNSFFTANLTLVNNGSSPILPSDIYEKIGLEVNKSSKIISVRSIEGNMLTKFSWSKVDDRHFEAEPTLLNPGDQSISLVYITKDSDSNSPLSYGDAPLLSLHGRIVNMKSFSVAPPANGQPSFGPLQISIFGAGVPFFIASFLTYQAIYIFAFFKSGVFSGGFRQLVVLLLGVSFVSAASSDASCTYIFGVLIGNRIDHNVANYLNAPWIVLNLILIVFFSFFYKTGERGVHAAT